MSKEHKPWKRAAELALKCKNGRKLCCFIRQTEEIGSEVVFYLEPGGEQVGRRTAENAIRHGLLVPLNDGLFGPETSQTFEAK
jgi:hypothetical protein